MKFTNLESNPNWQAQEKHVLDLWDQNHTFEKLQAKNKGGEAFSLLDGPVTANNPMGVHHAWGRTLKDVYQRFWALRGRELRYQNGFDCQGLWVEVEVEKSLNLNSKKEVEEFGLENFATACKERVAHFAALQTEQSKRLGQWMDWDNSYFTMSDNNVEYNWKFLKECNEKGLLYQDKRAVDWCPRCGTSLSQHEQMGSYKDLMHPDAWVFFKLDNEDASLLVWTTTPWTLTANAAVAVNPDLMYVLLEQDGKKFYVSEYAHNKLFSHLVALERVKGSFFEGLSYSPLYGDLHDSSEYKVVKWGQVLESEGSGFVHLAPGCGQEDYEQGLKHNLAVYEVLDEAGKFKLGLDRFSGLDTNQASKVVLEELRKQQLLFSSNLHEHRYPVCWRCQTELVFRLSDEWFLSADKMRAELKEANEEVSYTPSFYKKRMTDWLANMDDWCVSRKRYWGLPLPFYPCKTCDVVHVVGSKHELAKMATCGMDKLKELHRPYVDEVKVACPTCKGELSRVLDVGDCWLDAGVVPFSTLGYQNDTEKPLGNADGAAAGLTGASLPSHETWERYFQADLVVEMREQVRLWFYAMLFMSTVFEGKAPYKAVLTYEKVNDKDGKPMHKSSGNALMLDDVLEVTSADALRFMYAKHPSAQNLNFDLVETDHVKREFLTLWHTVSFFVQNANRLDEGFLGHKPVHVLDKYLQSRTNKLVQETTHALENLQTSEYCKLLLAYLDELSNVYVRASRKRFSKEKDLSAFASLYEALLTYLTLLAPVMPFLSEHLYQVLKTPVMPDSVHLTNWPALSFTKEDEDRLQKMQAANQVLALGRHARALANRPLRQPLSTMHVKTDTDLTLYKDYLCKELSLQEVCFKDSLSGNYKPKLNLPMLGKRLGKDLPKLRQEALENYKLENGQLVTQSFRLLSEEFSLTYEAKEGFSFAENTKNKVLLDTRLDDELEKLGLVREFSHQVQKLRKEQGFVVEDELELSYWSNDEALVSLLETSKSQLQEEVNLSYLRFRKNTGQTLTVKGKALQVELLKNK